MTADNISVQLDYYNHRLPTPNWEIIEKRNDFTDITYILKGEAVYYIDGQAHTVRAGDLLCIPSGSLRSAHSFSDNLLEAQSMNLHVFSVDDSPYRLPFPLVTYIGFHPKLNSLYLEIQKAWLMRSSFYYLHANAYALLVLEYLFQVIALNDIPHVTDSRIRQAMEYVAAHYNQPLTLPAVADIYSLSPMYFGNLFKQQTGMTFRQYVTSIRLNQAESMLASGEYRVGEVAEMCGFSDIFYFSKVYREQKGISPSKVFLPVQNE